MSSEGPYGRQGFQSNPSGYGGTGGGYSQPGAGGYSAPQYGQGYGGASYAAPAPQAGMYGGGGGIGAGYGGGYSDQVGTIYFTSYDSYHLSLMDGHCRFFYVARNQNGRTKNDTERFAKIPFWCLAVLRFNVYLRGDIFEF